MLTLKRQALQTRSNGHCDDKIACCDVLRQCAIIRVTASCMHANMHLPVVEILSALAWNYVYM